MTKRHPPAKPELRDRWSFDDDHPVASTARHDDSPTARHDDSPTARYDDSPAAPYGDSPETRQDDLFEAREDDVPETREDNVPEARQEDWPYMRPVERDLLFQPTAETSRPARIQTPPSAPAPQGARFAARPAQNAAPSPWATIRVSDKARARAAAAGLNRYVEEKRASPRASWIVVSTIVLLTAGAAFGLYMLADPQAPATIQSAETPTGEPDADRPSAAIEVPPDSPAMAAPAREAPPGPARDTPLIEVAP